MTPVGYTPKFSLGERVWHLTIGIWQERRPCTVCGGQGRVHFPGATRDSVCPETNCSSGRVWLPTSTKVFDIKGPLTIRQVQVKVIDTLRPGDSVQDDEVLPPFVKQVRYMCEETEVGSGTSYDEEGLYRTHEEAEAAARSAGAKTREEASGG